MTYPKAIVISAALIATAIAFAAHQPAKSAFDNLGPYMVVSDTGIHGAWVLNTTTGQARFCNLSILDFGVSCYEAKMITP